MTLTDTGYEYEGTTHTAKTVFRALYLRHDVLEPYQPTMTEISPFIDGVIERIVVQSKDEDATYDFDDEELYKNGGILLEKLRIESLLEVGDEIEIIEGDMVGMSRSSHRNFEERHSTNRCEVGRWRNRGSETSWMNFALHFDQETPSQSRLVVLAGRTGLVEVIDEKTLIVRELNTLKEVRRNIQIKEYN